MATAGIEEVTENAIRAVARDCGSLSMECSDVAGYVKGVGERIGEHLKMLDQLEEVTTRLLTDAGRDALHVASHVAAFHRQRSAVACDRADGVFSDFFNPQSGHRRVHPPNKIRNGDTKNVLLLR